MQTIRSLFHHVVQGGGVIVVCAYFVTRAHIFKNNPSRMSHLGGK
jgi:hypothetical protein